MRIIGSSFQCCIKDGSRPTASASPRTDEVCKPPEGAVFKRHVAEPSSKKVFVKASGTCKEAEQK